MRPSSRSRRGIGTAWAPPCRLPERLPSCKRDICASASQGRGIHRAATEDRLSRTSKSPAWIALSVALPGSWSNSSFRRPVFGPIVPFCTSYRVRRAPMAIGRPHLGRKRQPNPAGVSLRGSLPRRESGRCLEPHLRKLDTARGT